MVTVTGRGDNPIHDIFHGKMDVNGISKIRLLFQGCVCEESLIDSAHLKLSSWHVEAIDVQVKAAEGDG